MAQVRIQRRNNVNRTARIYVFTVDHEDGQKQVKTGCNMFSAPFVDDKGERCDSCTKCKESQEVIALCLYKKPEKKKAGKIVKGEKRESKINYNQIVSLLIAGKAKAEVIAYLQTVTSTENAAKDLYSKVSCVYGACVFPNRKDSLVYQVVRDVLNTACTLSDCNKKYEGQHKGSIKYSFDVATAFKALKAEN